MNDIDIVGMTGPVSFDYEETTVQIRYVLRGGVPVLQYPVKYRRGMNCGIEWRDVPVVEDAT